MRTIRFVPGAITTASDITIPAGEPDIGAVVSAVITRLGVGVADHPTATVMLGVGDHATADVIAGVIDHPAAGIIAGVIDHPAADVLAGVIDHPAADIDASLADHAVHAHDLLVAVGAAVEAYGASGGGVADLESLTGQTVAGAGVGGGVQNNAAAQAHGAGAADVAHVAGAAVSHAAGAAAVHAAGVAVTHGVGVDVAHVGADPEVAAVPTKSTTRIITLDVNTILGDLLTLDYLEVGEPVLAS